MDGCGGGESRETKESEWGELGNLLADLSRDFVAEEPHYVNLFSNCSATTTTHLLREGQDKTVPKSASKQCQSPRRAQKRWNTFSTIKRHI